MGYIILTDEMLLRLLRTSDEKAYETIFNRHWRGMYQIAFGKTRNVYVAEEIVQQIFLSLWERRESLQIKNLSAYLHQSVRYQCIHFFEKKYTTVDEGKLQQTASDYKSDNSVLCADLHTAMHKALNQLPPKTKTVFTLSRFEKYSVRERYTCRMCNCGPMHRWGVRSGPGGG